MVWFFVTVMVPLLAPFLLVPIFWILPISALLKVDAKLVRYFPLRSKFLWVPFGIGITSI